MEILFMEDFAVGFGVAFITMLALIFVAAAVAIAGIAEEEKAGHRVLWAEWPTDEKAKVVRKVEFLKAA